MKLFDVLYAIKEDALAKLKKPLAYKRAKRALEAAKDSIDTQILENENEQQKARTRFVNGDSGALAEIVALRIEQEQLEEHQMALAEEENELFELDQDEESEDPA